MDATVLLSLLATAIISTCLGVGCAVAYLKRDSVATRKPKPSGSPEVTPTFAAELAQLATDQASLFSTLEKLNTTVKRLSSRQGMRDVRERGSSEPPPIGTPKAELLRHYGMSGLVGPEFARKQQQLDLEQRH